MGTNVISGSAKGIVVSTGDDTIFGGIAEELNQEPTVMKNLYVKKYGELL